MTAPASEPSPAESPAEAAPPSRARRWLARLSRLKGPIAAVAGVGAILSGLAGYWTTYQTWHKATEGAARTASAPAMAAMPTLSIAVLPFSNLTGDPGQAYVADGLTASVAADLSRIRDAYIVNPAAAARFKDTALTLPQLGQELGVHYVLQGGVQRSGERLLVQARLSDTRTGTQLWAERFEGDAGNLFALQDQVTKRTAISGERAMVIHAGRESENRKGNPVAADFMLRAQAMRLRPLNVDTLRQAAELAGKALELEPDNTLALAIRASNLLVRARYYWFDAPDSPERTALYAEAHSLLERVRKIEPDGPALHRLLALYAESQGDIPGYLRSSERAVELDPNNPVALNILGEALLRHGEPRRALEPLMRSYELNPKFPLDVLVFNVGWAHFMARDLPRTVEWFTKAIVVNPANTDAWAFLAMAYTLQGDTSQAQASLARLREADPKSTFLLRRKPQPTSPPAFQKYYNELYLPAARKAGLIS